MRRLLVAPLLLSAFLLSACSATTEITRTLDLTDQRTAVRLAPPETVRVVERHPVFVQAPGRTSTVPETVTVYEKPLSASVPTFPIQSIEVDSAYVLVAGLDREYRLAAPCFGERLIGVAESETEMSFSVEGDCTPRDTIVSVTVEKESTLEKAVDLAGRFALLSVVLLVAALFLRGVMERVLAF